MFFQFEMHGGIFQSCWSLTESLRGGECITGTGGDGGPRGTRLCLNFGGSIGSSGASTIRITRDDAPPAWLFPWFDGVYRMYVGALRSACARSSEPALCAAASATFFSIASRVRSEFSAATSSSGFASSSSVRFFAASAVDDEWIVFPARWPTVAIRSCRAFPVASVCSASTCEPPALPFRPMSSGYCATWISGYAPPSAKSACERGTQPLRCPCGGTLRDGGGAGAGARSGSSSSSRRWVGRGSIKAAICESGARGGGDACVLEFCGRRAARSSNMGKCNYSAARWLLKAPLASKTTHLESKRAPVDAHACRRPPPRSRASSPTTSSTSSASSRRRSSSSSPSSAARTSRRPPSPRSSRCWATATSRSVTTSSGRATRRPSSTWSSPAAFNSTANSSTVASARSAPSTGRRFGELGLSGTPRARAARATTACHLLFLNAEAFTSRFAVFCEERNSSIISFLQSVSVLSGLSRQTFVTLSYLVQRRSHRRGHRLHVQSRRADAALPTAVAPAQELCFIVSGRAELVASGVAGAPGFGETSIVLSTLSAGAVVGDVAAFAPWRPAEAAVSLSVRAAAEVELLALPIEDALGFLPKEVVAQLRTDAARRAVWQKETLDQLVRARQRTRMPPAARAKAAAAQGDGGARGRPTRRAPTKPASSVRRPASAGGALSRSYLPLSTSSSAPALH